MDTTWPWGGKPGTGTGQTGYPDGANRVLGRGPHSPDRPQEEVERSQRGQGAEHVQGPLQHRQPQPGQRPRPWPRPVTGSRPRRHLRGIERDRGGQGGGPAVQQQQEEDEEEAAGLRPQHGRAARSGAAAGQAQEGGGPVLCSAGTVRARRSRTRRSGAAPFRGALGRCEAPCVGLGSAGRCGGCPSCPTTATAALTA